MENNQMQLPFVIHHYKEVQREHFEVFVEHAFGQPYNFLKDQKVVSGVDCLFDVKHDTSTYEYEVRQLAEFIQSGYYNDIAQVLWNNMLKRGLIEPDKYLIVT